MLLGFLILLLCVPSVARAQAEFEYLATYEGDGSEANPFRAHSGMVGTKCKSLRASETSQAGLAYCVGPALPVRAGIIDVTGKRTLSKADRDEILAASGIAVTAATVGSLVSELVDGQGVSLKRKDGRQRIVVNGREIWSRPAPLSSYLPDLWNIAKSIIATPMAWAAAILDEDWNCADDNTPNYTCDHIWVRYAGSTAQLLTNSLRNVNSVGTNLLYNDSTLDSTDMLHRVTVSSIARGTATIVAGGAGARHTGTTTSTYVYCQAVDAATQQIEYGHVVTGSLTTDGTVSATVSDGDTIEVRAVGDQLSCKHNGALVLVPITENTGNGNVNVMVRFSGSGTATTTLVALDNSHAEVVTGRRAGAPLRFP